jgi:antitoxin component YwqK of YwqJK toxin-antitoxin module
MKPLSIQVLFFFSSWLLLSCKGGIKEPLATEQEQKVQPFPVVPDLIIQKDDPKLSLNNGKYFYGGQPFSGHITEKDTHEHTTASLSYWEGLEEGWSEWYYPGGYRQARRFYHQGEKDSIHQGWWSNGQMQFEYHFKEGNYQGWFREWYPSGKPLKAIWYERGEEKRGMGWRENGKTYMSFEVRNGRMFGLVNPNLCYSLKNEQGEFVRSVPK